MGATAAVHPTDQTLQSYGLGKLDDASAASVDKHLESCADCRSRVAEMTSDSFLGRLRDVQAQPGLRDSGPVVSSLAGLSMLDAGARVAVPPTAETLPPGLADHPDYEVVRELGQGGMGTVYLALNRLMGRHEVLKVVSSHLMNRRGVHDRFLGEIRNAARLHHTNIVTAYSAMRIGESIVFAMEYVEGLDLSRLVKAKSPLPAANACNFVHEAALGLQHAHEQGMVHRDIKPSNLMLTRQGSRAAIKVLDFGLAKVKSEGAVDGGLTHEGQMLGTPEYVAPEQTIDARKADIRADIYSLGCTLYYLLTGGPPFQATSLYELLQAHHSMDALPLNLARPEVPVELAAIVAKMMAKEPERRFQEPKEVAQALLPFFKKGAVGAGLSKAEMSQAGGTVERQAMTEARSVSTQPVASTTPAPPPPAKKPAATARPENPWESLIEFKETEPIREPAQTLADSVRPPRWLWPSVAVGLLLVGFIAAWAVIIRVKTKDGEIVVKNVPEEAVASIDGEKVKLKLSGKPDPVEITVAPNGKQVSVKTGETEATGEEVNIGTGDGKGISAAFEPRVPTSPKEDEIKEPPLPASEGEIRPFNGGNFEGWNGLYRKEIIDPSKVFRIEREELVWAGHAGRIFTNNSFRDFSFKFEYLLPLNGRYGTTFCVFKLAEGDPYQISEANFRVRQAGCALTNGQWGMTGDIVLEAYDLENADPHLAQRTADATRPANEWNEVEVRCEGRQISFFLNGRQVNRVVGNRDITCHPGFNSWDADIRFRNVRIIPLVTAGLGPAPKNPKRLKAREKSASRKSANSKFADALQPGSVWEGTWTFEDPRYPGQRASYKFVITDRSGNRFKAESVFQMDTFSVRSNFEGTIQSDRIEYEEVGPEAYRFSSLGTIVGNKITSRFQGTGTAGNARYGKGEMTLQEK
jgi:serine/threonine protein kinase